MRGVQEPFLRRLGKLGLFLLFWGRRLERDALASSIALKLSDFERLSEEEAQETR